MLYSHKASEAFQEQPIYTSVPNRGTQHRQRAAHTHSQRTSTQTKPAFGSDRFQLGTFREDAFVHIPPQGYEELTGQRHHPDPSHPAAACGKPNHTLACSISHFRLSRLRAGAALPPWRLSQSNREAQLPFHLAQFQRQIELSHKRCITSGGSFLNPYIAAFFFHWSLPNILLSRFAGRSHPLVFLGHIIYTAFQIFLRRLLASTRNSTEQDLLFFFRQAIMRKP